MTDQDRPPRENLYRGVFAFDELRNDPRPASGFLGRILVGHFGVFNRWTEVNSRYEGNFMERMASGAFHKTISEGRPKVLFNHGQEHSVGNQVLGPITELREDDVGAYYEVPLYDTSFNRDLLPGLENGSYGASFRFSVPSGKETFERRTRPSDYNPKGLPERTVHEAAVREFGPVTWPVYPDATASVRSLTDDFILLRLGETTMTNQRAGNEPYGDVEYADPGYQSDKKKRYPIDTAEHVHAALSYIGKAHNAAQYTAEQLSEIKGRIHAAAKKFDIQVSDDGGNSDGGRSQDVDLERNADGSLIAEEPTRSAPVVTQRSKPSGLAPLVVVRPS